MAWGQGGNRKLPRASFENFSKSESWKSHSPSCLQDIKPPNWVVVSNLLYFSSLFGEDEPILTSIFFRWVETQPPTRQVEVAGSPENAWVSKFGIP